MGDALKNRITNMIDELEGRIPSNVQKEIDKAKSEQEIYELLLKSYREIIEQQNGFEPNTIIMHPTIYKLLVPPKTAEFIELELNLVNKLEDEE